MQYNPFYIKAIHKINTVKLKAFVLGLGKIEKENIKYDNCILTKVINQKIAESPESAGVLLQIDYVHKQYHENAEKIIELKETDPEKAYKLINALKDNSSYILEQIAKF